MVSPCPNCFDLSKEVFDTTDPGNQSYPSVDSTGEDYHPAFEAWNKLSDEEKDISDYIDFKSGFIAGAQSSLQPVDELAIEAMDFYWRYLMNELGRKDLGDIERKNYEKLAAQLKQQITSPTSSPDPTVLVQALERMCNSVQKLFDEKKNNPKDKRGSLRAAWNKVSGILFDSKQAINKYNNKKEEGI